jgi:low affinity Fe/Cu permease
MTRSNEPEKKRGKPRTKSSLEKKKMAAGSFYCMPPSGSYSTDNILISMRSQTLAVWIMTLLIQRANRRDTLALHAKLDE